MSNTKIILTIIVIFLLVLCHDKGMGMNTHTQVVGVKLGADFLKVIWQYSYNPQNAAILGLLLVVYPNWRINTEIFIPLLFVIEKLETT